MEKLTHEKLVTSGGKVITVSTWNRDSGPTSQTITTQHPSGKTTVERVSGGKLIP